jgi:diguanylate cyclase (GGDEF)-like protein
MEIRLYFQMLRRGWWMIVLAALVAIIASLTLSYLATPMYQSTASFIISPNATLVDSKDLVNSLNTLDRRSIASTYAEVMNSSRIYADTLAALKVNSTDLTEYTYQTVVLPEASVLQLTVTGPDPQTAANLANALGYQAIQFTNRLNQVYDVNFLDTAQPATEPVSPQPLRDAALAGVLGAVLGAVLAILREQIRTPFDALRQRSTVDTASSAFNQRHFKRALEEAQARSLTGNIGLGLIQLDGLNDLIDTLPPVLSQQLLHEITRKLRNELRGNDIVGRWSDSEFAVMLPSTPVNAAERTMDRVRQALTEPILISQSNDSVRLEPYVGMAVSQPQESVSSLINRAEEALSQGRRKYLSDISTSIPSKPKTGQVQVP